MKKEYLKNVKVLSKFISKIPEKGLHFEYRWQFVRFINRFTTENVANVVDELYGKLYYQKILPSN